MSNAVLEKKLNNMELKFTQEIKDKWLADLKSGANKQGFGRLYNDTDNSYCCYGRLSKIIGEDDLNRFVSGKAFEIIVIAAGNEKADELWQANDKGRDDKSYPRDYSNVIQLIEALPLSE